MAAEARYILIKCDINIIKTGACVRVNDDESAMHIAQQMRCGMVHINGAPLVAEAPFGGYKQSGNGREWGLDGLKEYLEVKAIMAVPQ